MASLVGFGQEGIPLADAHGEHEGTRQQPYFAQGDFV